MNDLISRKALLQKLEGKNSYYVNTATTEQIMKSSAYADCICIIEHEPTAYDVDKVVERLELENKRLKTLKNNCIALCDHEVIGIENKAYDYAIKIVRNGGQKLDWSVEMRDKEQQFILKMLNRFIKKMCVTKDRNELQSSTVWAIRYVMMLNDMRDTEMFNKQVYGDEVEE